MTQPAVSSPPESRSLSPDHEIVAVASFTNTGEPTRDEWVGAAIAESILTDIGGANGIRVAADTTCFETACPELDPTLMVSGSFHQSDNGGFTSRLASLMLKAAP